MDRNTVLEWLPLKDLIIDPQVQRTHLRQSHIKQIANNFDSDAFGTLLVSRRGDGSLSLLDGQHRVHALKLMGWHGNQCVPCEVHQGLTLRQEAQLFIQRNTTAKPNKIDLWNSRLTKGEQTVVDIDTLVRRNGWEIPRKLTQADGKIPSVDALESVYSGYGIKGERRNMPEALDLTLRIITKAWGHDKRASQAVIIKGIGAVARRDLDKIDVEPLCIRLAALPAGPDSLIGMGRALLSGNSNLSNAISEAVVRLHNYSKRTRKIGDWNA